MSARSLLTWIALGLVGVALAVAVTTAATELTSQEIGLQSEPLDAGEALAPERPRRTATAEPTAEATREPPAEPTAEPTETEDPGDDSGRGRGRGRGRGGDDD